jgi:hypothetical protein
MGLPMSKKSPFDSRKRQKFSYDGPEVFIAVNAIFLHCEILSKYTALLASTVKSSEIFMFSTESMPVLGCTEPPIQSKLGLLARKK